MVVPTPGKSAPASSEHCSGDEFELDFFIGFNDKNLYPRDTRRYDRTFDFGFRAAFY